MGFRNWTTPAMAQVQDHEWIELAQDREKASQIVNYILENLPANLWTTEKVGMMTDIQLGIARGKQPLSGKQLLALLQMKGEVDLIIALRDFKLYRREEYKRASRSPDEVERVAAGLAALRDRLASKNEQVVTAEQIADAKRAAWLASKREEALTLHRATVQAETHTEYGTSASQ